MNRSIKLFEFTVEDLSCSSLVTDRAVSFSLTEGVLSTRIETRLSPTMEERLSSEGIERLCTRIERFIKMEKRELGIAYTYASLWRHIPYRYPWWAPLKIIWVFNRFTSTCNILIPMWQKDSIERVRTFVQCEETNLFFLLEILNAMLRTRERWPRCGWFVIMM